MPKKNALEEALQGQMREAALPLFEREVRLIEGRRLRWDFVFQAPYKLAIEVQGGIFMRRGGHTTGVGITRDCEKMCLAALVGYHTMSFTADHVRSGQALIWVTEFINGKDRK